MLCVTITIVYSETRSRIRSSILAVAIGSRAEHGSSIRITSGFVAIARAMQRRCCCPPESAIAESFSFLFTSSQSAARWSDSSTRSSMLPLKPAILGPKATLS